MKNKKPPFEINERIMTDVIEIAELIGKASVTAELPYRVESHWGYKRI